MRTRLLALLFVRARTKLCIEASKRSDWCCDIPVTEYIAGGHEGDVARARGDCEEIEDI